MLFFLRPIKRKEKYMEENNNVTTQIKKEEFSILYHHGGDERNIFSSVVGHDNQKKELLTIIDWFNRSKELREKGLSIPKGVILNGAPGNGKSLLIKEAIKACNSPVFIFRGEEDNVVGSIVKTFENAKKTGHAIIVFDELDLLINKDRRVVRVLQEYLDGVESADDILVLSATNDIDDIPDALLRNGRLEKILYIPYLKGPELVKLLKYYFDLYKAEFPKDADEDELEVSLNHVTCSGIKAIVNDALLRNGWDNLTKEALDNSISNITERVKGSGEHGNMSIAYHEASHAVMAMKYPEYFVPNRLVLRETSGSFRAKQVDDNYDSYEKMLADAHISLAGNIGQFIIEGTGSQGCMEDLSRARSIVNTMVNRVGYKGAWRTLAAPSPYYRQPTIFKLRSNEHQIKKIFKKVEKETYSYLLKHKDKVIKLARLLYQKQSLKYSEIKECLSS